MIGKVVVGMLVLLAISGVAYGYDQFKKRREGQDEYRRETERMKAKLRDLEERLGRHNDQVKILVTELQRRRAAA